MGVADFPHYHFDPETVERSVYLITCECLLALHKMCEKGQRRGKEKNPEKCEFTFQVSIHRNVLSSLKRLVVHTSRPISVGRSVVKTV